MAKTRTTRRERRLETEKQIANGTFNPALLTKAVVVNNGVKATVNVHSTQNSDLTTEYYYVYSEVRNILLVAVAMLVVLFGLSQFI